MMRTLPLGVAALAVALALPRNVEASPPPAETRADRWYGWQLLFGHLAVDASGALLLARMRGFSPDGLANNLVPMYFTIPSHVALSLAVHGSHRQWRNLGGGLGLQLGMPAGGALVGTLAALFSGQMKEGKVPPHLPVSVAIASHVGSIIEVAGFSYFQRPAAPGGRPRVVAVPQVVPVSGGLMLGVAGSL